MTTKQRTENASESDSNLWQLVCRGSASAFEVLVRRYQSLVCSVAYSACGDLALSEDVAQETFWTAWRQRASLEQPDYLKAWLCGIARNLAKNARRKASRPVESAATQDVLTAHAAGAKTALAGAGASAGAGAWKAAAGAAGAGGALGGLLGTLGGLLGGWLGTWVPAQTAPTRRERDAILCAGWRMLLVSVVFMAALYGLIEV